VYEANPIRSLETGHRDHVSVSTDAGEFHAHCLVGADGANSVVREVLNRRQDFFWQAAVQCEVPEEAINTEAARPDAIVVDWGTLPSGYAWAFPKRGFVNIGAGGPLAIAKHLKRYVTAFAESHRLLKPGFADRLKLVGHQLPTMTHTSKAAGQRVLLVGDAAGLVEPFTGDGISFACQSARLAADCIYQSLNAQEVDLTSYDSHLAMQIRSELLWSRKLLSLSVSFPRLIYRMFRSNDRVWNTFCKTLRGEATFYRLKRDVLGPLAFAWKAIDLFTELRERAVLAGVPGRDLLRSVAGT
jgi:flavin-dependent dehydrogenase